MADLKPCVFVRLGTEQFRPRFQGARQASCNASVWPNNWGSVDLARLAAFDPFQTFATRSILPPTLAGFEGENGMTISVKQMIETADAAVPRISPAHAREMIAKGNTLVVDVRDAPEVEKSGKIAGSVHVSLGMLEFRADPESPYHDKNFAKD